MNKKIGTTVQRIFVDNVWARIFKNIGFRVEPLLHLIRLRQNLNPRVEGYTLKEKDPKPSRS